MPRPVLGCIIVRDLVARGWMLLLLLWLLLLGRLRRLRKKDVLWKLGRIRREEVLRVPCCWRRETLLTEDGRGLHCSQQPGICSLGANRTV